MLTINFHGVELSAADFPATLEGKIAFNILFASNARCGSKEVAVELLMSEAASIIKQVEQAKG
jgi:hypothetical protein